jgi:hypothetical protein
MHCRLSAAALVGTMTLVLSTIGVGAIVPAAQANEILEGSATGYPNCGSEKQTWCIESASID